MRCPKCQSEERQSKCGFNPSGSQKYKCGECKRVYTPEPNPNGYPAKTRLLAIRMYVEGNSYGAIGRILKVNPQSVTNWVKRHIANLPPAPVPEKPRIAELDELYTYIGKKKTKSMS
jgi:transposase-like protein